MSVNVQTTRLLTSWIDGFLEWSEPFESPVIFRKWAAIGAIAGALERKVWTVTKGDALYPNLYLILVGPPGKGKSFVLKEVERLLRAVPEIHVAPTDVTTASLIDSLDAAIRKPFHPLTFQPMIFNYVTVVASELGNFLPAYESTFVNFLQKVYDGEFYEQARRTAKKTIIRLDRAQITILGGTTPAYLNSFLPAGAWDQGFTARTIFIHSAESIKADIFNKENVSDRRELLYNNLASDLKEISCLVGQMEWTPEAQAEINSWYSRDLPPVPEHPKLVHYNTRRLAHSIKLSIIASISRSSDFTISASDFLQARDWMLEAEDTVPDIFNTGGIAGDAKAIDDCWYFVYQTYQKEKKPILERRVINNLMSRVPSYSISKIIEVMRSTGLLILDPVNGLNAYRPGARN